VIRILLADDHAVVRSGLRHVLGAEDDMEVVAEAGDLEETLRKVRGHRPDVLVLDLNLGRASSLPAIPELSALTRVVVLTMQDDPAFARRALADGAAGFVLKETAEGVLLDAVRQAAAGGTYLDPALGARLAAAPAGPPTGSRTASSRSCACWRSATRTPRWPSRCSSACGPWRATAPRRPARRAALTGRARPLRARPPAARARDLTPGRGRAGTPAGRCPRPGRR
jgi:DNA-binding NarL/FixJ family response regulator